MRDQVAALEARVAQLQADAAKLESRAASYHFEYQPLGPSWMCSSQAEDPTEAYPRSTRSKSSITTISLGDAEHSLAQKPANVRAVPKIFPQ